MTILFRSTLLLSNRLEAMYQVSNIFLPVIPKCDIWKIPVDINRKGFIKCAQSGDVADSKARSQR